MPERSGYKTAGGWASGNEQVNGNTVPQILTVDERHMNTPSEYKASQWIQITDGFTSGTTDEFVAYIADGSNTTAGNPGGSGGENNTYRYGFNGKENDDEVKGVGDDVDYGARIYDTRLGRWLSVDPLFKGYPFVAPYTYALNTPIRAKDPDGKVVIFINGMHNGDGGTSNYWDGYDDKLMNRVGDHSARYVDGALGGVKNILHKYWEGYERDNRSLWKRILWPLSEDAKRLQGALAVLNESSVNEKVRENAGYAQGAKDAEAVFNNVTEGETIKIVTHSMGGAFSRGYIKALQQYQAKNASAASHKIEMLLDINTFQGKEVSNVSGIDRKLNKTGGEDGKDVLGAIASLVNGIISVPTVAPVVNSTDITTADEKTKGHSIGQMTVGKVPYLGNPGIKSNKPVEEGSNNENKR